MGDDEIKQLCKQVHDLLDDPQPGLSTWNTLLCAQARRLRAALDAKLGDRA